MVSEYQIEEILYVNPEMIEDGLTIIGRQHQIDNGIVDLLAKDKEGNLVIIEVKVNAEHDAVSQIAKYFIYFKKDAPDEKIRSILIAKDIPKQVRELCEFFNIEALTLNELKNRPKLTNLEELNKRLDNIERVLALRTSNSNKLKNNLGYLPFNLTPTMRKIVSGMVEYGKPFTYDGLSKELNVSQGTIRSQIYELLRRNPNFPLKMQKTSNTITDYNLFESPKR